MPGQRGLLRMQGALLQFLADRLTEAKTNRSEAEALWNFCDRTVDGHGCAWKPGQDDPAIRPDGTRSFGSKLRYPLAAQRSTAAATLANDALFPMNAVPLEVQGLDPDGAGPAVPASTLHPQRALAGMLERCDAVSEFLACFKDAARYGDAYGQYYRDGESFGVAHVPVRECFQDWSHVRIDAGSYFFRVQERRKHEASAILERFSFIVPALLKSALDKGAEKPLSETGGDGRDRLPAGRPDTTVVEAWASVPREAVAEWLSSVAASMADADADGAQPAVPPAAAGGGGDDDGTTRVKVVAYIVNDELVGVLPDAGACPYFRFVWERWPNRTYGRGLVEPLAELQDATTGSLRALDDGGKLATGAAIGHDSTDELGFTDIRDAIATGKVFPLPPGMDPAKMIHLLQLKVDLGPMLETFREFVGLGDLVSPVQLAQSGQGSNDARTFSELQLRLDNAGKYMLGVVRNFARFASEMLDGIWREILAAMEEQDRAGYAASRVKATFEASYLKRLELQKALLFVLDVAAKVPQFARRVNWDALVDLLLASTAIKSEEILYPADSPALAAADQAEAAKAQAEQLLAQAQLAKAQAEQARAQAQAQELETRAALNEARSLREQATAAVLEAGIETDRARTANEVRKTVAAERAAQSPARSAVPSVPDPGRAAAIPGGPI